MIVHRSSLSCAWRLTKGSVRGGLPEMSNCYCHPGRAGGLPVLANLDQRVTSLRNKKLRLRKVQACSYDAVLDVIREALKTYSPNECTNYLKNCGYEAV